MANAPAAYRRLTGALSQPPAPCWLSGRRGSGPGRDPVPGAPGGALRRWGPSRPGAVEGGGRAGRDAGRPGPGAATSRAARSWREVLLGHLMTTRGLDYAPTAPARQARVCELCESPLVATRKSQRFCSQVCAYDWRAGARAPYVRPADPPAGMKRCRMCREVKTVAEFYPRKRACGRTAWCAKCANLATMSSRRRLKLGVSDAQYNQMVGVQCGNCAICGLPENARNRRLNVDHDHQTGQVRGLLCSNCNTALGLFKDSPVTLKNALHYLREQVPVDARA
jgi:hypothetical protein